MKEIEKAYFSRYTVVIDKLLAYGFIEEGKSYIYKKKINNGEFEVIITYDGKVDGKIIDLSLEEEYTNFRRIDAGSFSNKIKSEYETILIDIRTFCFIERYFIAGQANRINDYLFNKYQVTPSFLWKKYPHYAVYRKNDNKWFAVILDIKLNKIDKDLESEEIIEIINVKINPSFKVEYLKKKGIYEAYHMNKKSWITLKLDDTLSDAFIIDLIDQSYKNVRE